MQLKIPLENAMGKWQWKLSLEIAIGISMPFKNACKNAIGRSRSKDAVRKSHCEMPLENAFENAFPKKNAAGKCHWKMPFENAI